MQKKIFHILLGHKSKKIAMQQKFSHGTKTNQNFKVYSCPRAVKK